MLHDVLEHLHESPKRSAERSTQTCTRTRLSLNHRSQSREPGQAARIGAGQNQPSAIRALLLVPRQMARARARI